MTLALKKFLGRYLNNPLIKKVAKGGLWLSFGNFFEQIFRLARNMVLARLLVPEAFGTIALLLTINQFYESFSMIGTKEAIIQDDAGDEKTYLNGAWWLTMARVSLLYLLVFFSAPLLAVYFHKPELVLYLRLISLSLIFRGAISVNAYIELKRIHFKKWTFIEQISGIIGISFAIIYALFYRNIWALIWGFIIENLSRMIMSYLLCPFVPGLHFNKEHTLKFLKFAKGIFGVSIFTFIFLRADIFFISKLNTDKLLGLYSLAYSLAHIPSLLFEKFVNPLFLPTFSSIKHDDKKVNNVLIQITELFSLLGMPIIFISLIYGKEILSLVYSPEYGQVGLAFAVLLTSDIIRAFVVPLVTLFITRGQPGYVRLFNLIRAVLILLLLYPMIQWLGVMGAAYSVLVTIIITLVIQVATLNRIITFDTKAYWLTLGKSLLFFLPSLGVLIIPWILNLSLVWIILSLIAALVFYAIIVLANKKRIRFLNRGSQIA